jgi:hypothetical protein
VLHLHREGPHDRRARLGSGTLLIVDDIQAARAELAARGADPSEVFHFDGTLRVTGTQGRVPGPDPERRSYSSCRLPAGDGHYEDAGHSRSKNSARKRSASMTCATRQFGAPAARRV